MLGGTSRFPQTPSTGPLRGQALRAGSNPTPAASVPSAFRPSARSSREPLVGEREEWASGGDRYDPGISGTAGLMVTKRSLFCSIQAAPPGV